MVCQLMSYMLSLSPIEENLRLTNNQNCEITFPCIARIAICKCSNMDWHAYASGHDISYLSLRLKSCPEVLILEMVPDHWHRPRTTATVIQARTSTMYPMDPPNCVCIAGSLSQREISLH